MASNDFLVFAGAGGANVLTQAQWAALAQLTTGYVSGILPSVNLNKGLRQSSIMSSMIGAFIAQQSGQNAVDDGTTATLLANFISAIGATCRIKVAANTTFYVNGGTGSDITGTGLVGAPWATIQHAVNAIQASYDGGGYAGTLSVADGTYAPFIVAGPFWGFGSFTIQGDLTTPANCIISNSAANTSCITAQHGAFFSLGGFKVTNAGSGTANGVYVAQNSVVNISGAMNFGAVLGGHVSVVDSGSMAYITTSYSITGGGVAHLIAIGASRLAYGGTPAISMSGTPAFSTAFASASDASSLSISSSIVSFSGAASGPRYLANLNGVVNTNGGGASFLPGSSAGSTSIGGQYA